MNMTKSMPLKAVDMKGAIKDHVIEDGGPSRQKSGIL